MIKFQKIILIFLLFAGTALAQENATISTEIIKGRFVNFVTRGWHDFKVCEYYSPAEDKMKFIDKSIAPEVTKEAISVDSKEIFVTNQDSYETLHLGVIVIGYPAEKSANSLINKIQQDGYLKNTKILTRYLLRRLGSRLIIYYSETFRYDKVNEYFSSLPVTEPRPDGLR